MDVKQNGLVQSNTAIDFIYYAQKIEWSAARAVCRSLGGDLAKIDSRELMNFLAWLAEDTYKTDIFVEEYWVGLVQLTEDERFWITDCANLTYTANFVQGFDPEKLCFRHKHDHSGERRLCTSKEGFMCQVQSPNNCQLTSLLKSEVLSVGTDMAGCQSLCEDDPDCWATVEYVPDNCVTLALPGHGVQNLTFTPKFCYNITLNTTTVIPDLTNNNAIPNATCGMLSITPTPTNSLVVTSIALPPCQLVNVTQNVTLTSTESITVTTTNYSTFTSTFTSTEQLNITFTETTTEITTATSTEIMTQNVTRTTFIFTDTTTSTESIYINWTDTVTSTVLSTYTQNVTTEQAEEVAAEIAKNLTVDSKSTSSHIRRLTSADDKRRSAKYLGYVGILCVTLPLGMLLLADIKKLFLDFRSHENIYKNRN
ncbi:uncharacterized protein LOC123548149 [Mercenaria mercenaria]|uniref:uncharacterized protein LOC123548149 n=1 Tax=Mercenaria mercenaria TaxID=6596 RepID=UPI00234E7B73|nr:uncharacterized protein LOC123548149 [Mercenaria mercenaria]